MASVVDVNDVVRIIGKRQGSSTYDVVTIIPKTVKSGFANVIISPQIPKTGNSGSIDTKIINLRRVKKTIAITGYIYNQDDASATGINVANFDTNGTYSGGTNVVDVLKKRWILEELAMAGVSGGEAHTVQYKNIITPITTGTPAPNESYNYFHKRASFTMCDITDGAEDGKDVDSTGRPISERMSVKLVLIWGNPQS